MEGEHEDWDSGLRKKAETPALGNFSGEGVLEKDHLSKHFSFLLFKCLFYVFIYRIIFPCLCHFTGSLLKYPKQIRILPLLVSWSQEWFFPSHARVLTLPVNVLIYNLNPHAIVNLILSIHRKQREYFGLGVEGFVAKYFFPLGTITQMFFWKLCGKCVLSWTVDSLDVEKT